MKEEEAKKKLEESLFQIRQAIAFALKVTEKNNILSKNPDEIMQQLQVVMVMRPEFLELSLNEKERDLYKAYVKKWEKEITISDKVVS